MSTMPLLVRVMDALQYRVAGLAAGRSFVEQLITRRKNSGWTMVEAASKAGISRTTLSWSRSRCRGRAWKVGQDG
mgnify:CR=1 FL=1